MLPVKRCWAAADGYAAGAVAKLLERAQPSLDYAAMKYMDAHNSIVASHAYCHALQSISVLLVQMQDSALFRAVYPVISPVADPTWETISHSTYYEVSWIRWGLPKCMLTCFPLIYACARHECLRLTCCMRQVFCSVTDGMGCCQLLPMAQSMVERRARCLACRRCYST